MSEHTPGPWEADGLQVHAHARGVISESPTAKNGGTFDAMANARLIAAAPDLLVAAKGIEEAWVERTLNADLSDLAIPDPIVAVDKLRAAIAKAEGS